MTVPIPTGKLKGMKYSVSGNRVLPSGAPEGADVFWNSLRPYSEYTCR